MFLFDEPLSNLDAQLRTEMRQEIKKIHQKLKTTFLYVTHDQTEAMTMADKIVVMKNGRIEQIATPHDIYQHPQSLFVASFMGHYSMNLIDIITDHTGDILFNGTLLKTKLENKIRKRNVILGIRPEHIHMTNESSENTFPAKIEWIEDTGSDKFIKVRERTTGISFMVRIPGDTVLKSHETHLNFDLTKAHVFCAKTTQRIGGLFEQERTD